MRSFSTPETLIPPPPVDQHPQHLQHVADYQVSLGSRRPTGGWMEADNKEVKMSQLQTSKHTTETNTAEQLVNLLH